MQVVENVEEDILCPVLIGKELDIIYHQYINHLVEMNKLIYRIILQVIDKLICKLFRRHIKHRFIAEVHLYLVANSMQKVRFAQPNSAMNNQRIKGCSARLIGNGKTC